MPENAEPNYRGVLLPERPCAEDLDAVVPDYQAMLVRVMAAIADRAGRRPGYPFLDTKLDLITGQDFADDDPVRGPNAVYGWIQGRGLEALAGHCTWMRRRGLGAGLVPRLEDLLRQVLESLRRIRARNAGHLFFWMTPEGAPFVLDAEGKPKPIVLTEASPFGFSDLFCAKGMYAAARYLDDEEAADEAFAYIGTVDEAIRDDSFVTDQQSLDPKNPVRSVPGRRAHGPFMIQIGAAALLAGCGRSESVEFGLRLVRHELAFHINLDGRVPELSDHDFWEAVDDRGRPFLDGGAVLSDPGHALECTGLALKFTATVRRQGLADAEQQAEIAGIEARMPAVLEHMFDLGFQPGPGGICKAFDLLSRKPLNTDMPWWSLPETMRAAAFCWRIAATDAGKQAALRILAACHNAFVKHYVRPDLHLMAYQTRSETGAVVPVIPATADADPGYHTGLSILDMLDVIEEQRGG